MKITDVVPPTMRAARIHQFGGPEAMRYETDVPTPPEPADGQVLLDVIAAGVGYWDGEVRRGEWQNMITYPLPLILGTDVAATVAAVGPGVGHLKPGDLVYGVADMTLSGANAEYALALAAALTRHPASLDPRRAAGVPVGASTGLELVRAADPRPGEHLLIVGAGGTVGSWALQWAASTGATITATASGADLDWVDQHGATNVVDHHASRIDTVVSGVDVVIDPVPGPDVVRQALAVLNPGGRLFACAAPLDDLQKEVPDRHLQFVSYVDTSEQFAYIAQAIDQRQVSPRIGEVIPLDKVVDAHRKLDGAPHRPGKIVLDIAAR